MCARNQHDTMSKITFKKREYTITDELAVPALLAKEGLQRQCIIQGAKGATRLLQIWSDGILRTISTSGKVEEQIV